VIAGHAGAVARAIEIAKGRGYRKTMPLPVSAPFHCALMQPAAERLRLVLDGIAVAAPQIPVVSNVEALPNADGGRVRDLLVSQVCAPVRWEESVQKMTELGVTRFIEIGPGKVLSGLVKRIAKDVAIANIESPAHLDSLRQ
jgi:[acyl-carrier-protein] S-malonyltransferase